MKKEKLYIRLSIGCIIFVFLFVILLFYFLSSSVRFVSYDTVLIDNDKGGGALDVIEPLYVNGKEVCRFSVPSSQLYKIWYRGRTYTLKRALEKKIVTLKQLQKVGLPCS